jgi:phosphoribosylglycinamide formyltransferase 1
LLSLRCFYKISSRYIYLIMKKIAIFASGSGTNAQAIVEYFKNNVDIRVSCILSNRPDAFVLERAKKLGIPSYTFTRDEYYNTSGILALLSENSVDFIALAGFLWLVPEYLIRAYPNRIVNIHPALLPKYGGKGMYGQKVHQAVIDNAETESGITIHLVNEKYDEGGIVFQAKCPVKPGDTPDSLASRIHLLEHEYYPRIIEKLLSDATVS